MMSTGHYVPRCVMFSTPLFSSCILTRLFVVEIEKQRTHERGHRDSFSEDKAYGV
jgi:hypothetical protein